MKKIWEDEEFCKDLTRDMLTDAELASLCGKTVQTARRRRLAKRTQGLSMLLAVVMVTIWILSKPTAPQVARQVEIPLAAPEASFTLVKSEQFEQVIKSQPLVPGSDYFANLEPVPILNSPPLPTYNPISDEQLLRFFEGEAVALVRIPGGGMDLEFFREEKSE